MKAKEAQSQRTAVFKVTSNSFYYVRAPEIYHSDLK